MSNNGKLSAAIYGCSGTSLTDEERQFFTEHQPLGFILFQRNCESPDQVRALVAEFKACIAHPNPLILIDQEGGRVARLKAPIWREHPPAGLFSDMVQEKGLEESQALLYANYRVTAATLQALGINVDCAPMIDLNIEGQDAIIGDRALGEDPEQVVTLGRTVCEALLDGGVLPIIKHIPGHGRAQCDSHKALPVVDADASLLEQTDFEPFKQLADMPMAMTAHITYTAFDAENCATLSPTVVQKVIREKIGFDGLLMTDDLSMHALDGSFADRVKQSIAAGCDVILHCNGEMDEMQEISAETPVLEGEALARFERAVALLTEPKAMPEDGSLEKLEALLTA